MRTWHFRIRTAGGGIVNTSVQAADQWRAEYLLERRYPGCSIISGS